MEKITNIFQEGIRFVNYGKANLAAQLMCHKAVVQDLVEKLLEKPELAEKLRINVESSRGKSFSKFAHIQIPCDVERLEQIYDILIGSQLIGNMGRKRSEAAIEKVGYDAFRFEMEVIERNREEIDEDITLPLAYYLTMVDVSRMYLWDKYKSVKEILLAYYKKSDYMTRRFWGLIPGIYLEQAFCIVGLIVKCREDHDQKIYQDILTAIMRSNTRGTKYIKRVQAFAGDELYQTLESSGIMDEALPIVMAGSISMLLVAESLNKDIIADYDLSKKLLLIFHFWERYMIQTQENEWEEELSPENMVFLEQFQNTFTVYNCVDAVVFGKENGGAGVKLSGQIYDLFGMDPRKLNSQKLNEQEVRALVSLSPSWNQKNYFFAMQISILCKYIHEIEEYIKERIVNNTAVLAYEYKEKEDWLLKEEKELEKRVKYFENQIENLDEINQRQRIEYEKLQKTLEEKEARYEKERSELISLRNFVYQSSKKGEDEREQEADFEHIVEVWKEQPVILIGGHNNWQNKIRQLFPKWKYISANQSTFPEQILNDRKYIICCTEVLAHSVYYKVLVNKQKKQLLIYTRGINVEKFLLEIKKQESVK